MALQRHIHLSTTIGAAPENAPNLKWVATDRLDIPVVIMSLVRGITGKLRRHVLANGSGVVQLNDWQYTIKVQADFGYTLEQRIAQIKAMNGKAVYLVDHFHPNDASDHTASIKPCVIQIGSLPPIGPGLQYFLVDVTLTDNSL